MTEERHSYDQLRNHYLTLFLTIARRGNSSLPVFSGDLSMILRLPHRAIKDVIETRFRELRLVYGKSIQIVRYKRRGGCRAMRGYLMPFRAMIHLLPYFKDSGVQLLQMPEFLYAYYSNGRSCYADSLN
jgi:hypothetical protein